MKTLKYFVLIGTLIIGVFFLPKISHAVIILEQTVSDTEAWHDSATSYTQGLGTGLNGTLTTIKNYLKWDGNNSSNAYLQLQCYTNNTYSGTYACPGWTSPTSTNQTITTSKTLATFDFTSQNITFNSSYWYAFTIQKTGSGNKIWPYGTTATSSNADIKIIENVTIKQAYFVVNDNTQYTISFYSPDFTDNMSSTDFRSWELNMTAPINSINAWRVKYKNASSTNWQYYDTIILDHKNTEALDGEMIPLSKNNDLPSNNQYIAQAEMFDTTLGQGNIVLASSSLLHFGIATGTPILHPGTENQPNGGLLYNDLWDSSYCQSLPFDATIFGVDFAKTACRLMAFLFIPGKDFTGLMSNNWTEAQTKIPFSYFFEVKNILSNLNTSSSTLSDIKLTTGSLPGISSGTQITLFSVSNITTVANGTSVAGSGFSTLRTISNFVLYALFGTMCYYTAIYLINREKK